MAVMDAGVVWFNGQWRERCPGWRQRKQAPSWRSLVRSVSVSFLWIWSTSIGTGPPGVYVVPFGGWGRWFRGFQVVMVRRPTKRTESMFSAVMAAVSQDVGD